MAGEAEIISTVLTLFGLGSDGGEDVLRRRTADINASLGSLNDNLHNSIVLETANTEAIIQTLHDLTVGQIISSQGSVEDALGAVIGELGLVIDSRNLATQFDVESSRDNVKGEVLRLLTLLNNENNIRKSSILSGIQNRGIETSTVLEDVIGAATRTIGTSQSTMQDMLDGLDLGVDLGFRKVNAGVTDILELLSRGIIANIKNEIIIEDTVFSEIFGVVTSVVNTVIGNNNTMLDGINRTITEGIGERLDIANIIAASNVDSFDRMANALDAANDQTADINRSIMMDGPEGVGGSLIGAAAEWLSDHAELTQDELLDAANQALFGDESPSAVIERCKIRFSTTKLAGDFATRFVDWITSALSVAILPLNMAQIQANRQMFEFRKCFPDQVMPPGDSIASFQHGLIPGSEAIENLRKQGLDGDDASTMIAAAYRVPEIQFLFSMWYREIITDDLLDWSLEALGFNPAWTDPFKEIALFIPPVQDLITMAVREVFTESVARAQGQFDDFPEDFATFAAKQGVKREWAERYWAAHWRLPSENMGFEMFHRGVIDEAKLRSLMTALDIMPGWRDELIAISYNPLTRVDIRRMHAMDVLDDDKTRTAYLAIGYSPENADLMLDFTKRYNDADEIIDVDVASDLTRSTIIGFYMDGIIERDIALGLMLQAGINVVAAELFLLNADFDLERKERKSVKDLIFDQFAFRQITFEVAVDKFNELNIEPIERELALLDLDKLNRRQNKIPSKADLGKFLTEGVINEDQYINNMILNGYSPTWANRYLELLNKGIETDDE